MLTAHMPDTSIEPTVIWSLYSYIVTEAIVDLVSQRKLVSDPAHAQELVRLSAVALFEAADTFDPNGTLDFHDYASMIVHRVLYTALRHDTRHSTRELAAQSRA